MPGFRKHLLALLLALGIGLLAFPTSQASAIPWGSITGTVTDTDGNPLQGICVNAFDSLGSQEANNASTDDAGKYSILLDSGSYRLKFRPCHPGPGKNFASEFYDDSETLEGATPVVVAAIAETPGIDAELAPGGSISGTVTATNGLALPALCVQAYGATGNERGIGFVGGDHYTVYGLVTGSYRLKFSDCFDVYNFTATPEFYSNKATLAEADPVGVTAGADTPGIDAQIETPDRDLVAPDTIIDSGPSGTIRKNVATFFFSSSDPGDTTKLQCRIDSGPFQVCFSPKTYTSLAEGPHTVYFWAQDSSDNQDQTPATRTFTVDTSVDTTVYAAAISRLSIKGPARVRKGRKVTHEVTISNSGNAEATDVVLKVRGGGSAFETQIGSIASGSSRIVKTGLKFKRPGRTKLTFKVTSSNAGGMSVERAITVRK